MSDPSTNPPPKGRHTTRATPPPFESIRAEVARALAEDIGEGDLTAALIPAGARSEATLIAREAGVVCGRPWFDEVFRQLDEQIVIEWWVAEGEAVAADTPLVRLRGPSRPLLSGERTALNFVQTLSATATATARYVAALAGSRTRLLDTRKTLPGLRLAQKYAVRCGGGQNHRIGLYDGILIKENHILAAGSITAAVTHAREIAAGRPVECEVESLAEAEEALHAGADILLLDNFPIPLLREAARLNRGRAKLEASGGVTLDRLPLIAASGVDFISVGAVTKDIAALDLSLRFT